MRELISAGHGSLFYLSHIKVTQPTAGVVGDSGTRHALHGERCATPPRPMREYNNRGRPHDFGDCSRPTTSVTAIRRVHDGPTTDPRQNSHRAVVEKIEHV